jgi:hypothetical protein
MSRTRVISAAEALYTSASPATGANQTATQLYRVQSATYNFKVNRVNVNQFGSLAPVSKEINETPTVSLDFSYFLTNLLNEYNLGFVTDGSTSAISGLLNRTSDEKNYYIAEAPEGQDANGYSGAGIYALGIGNGFLSNYSVEAAVGGFPTASVKVDALNLAAYTANTGVTPAINPVDGTRIAYNFTLPTAATGVSGQSSILKHGDITMSLSSAVGADVADIKIQKFSLGFDLKREPQQKLGAKFAIARNITFPVDVTLSVEAQVGDIAAGDLSSVICNDVSNTLSVTLAKPLCNGVGGQTAAVFTLKGAKLESQNFSSSIGPNKTVNLQWVASVGGPTDVTNNLFMSGVLV